MNDNNNDEMQVVIQEFLDESRTFADTLNHDLLTIEELIKANKEIPEDTLNEIFRAAHTIKGTSSFLGYNNIFKLMHSMETILDGIRKGKRTFEPHIIDIVFESFDTLGTLLSKLETDGSDEGDIDDIIARLKNIVNDETIAQGDDDEAKDTADVDKKAERKEPHEKPSRQLVSETLGDEFLFANTIINALDMLDAVEILKQKNRKNNIFEVFVETKNIDKAMKTIKELGEIFLYYKLNKDKDSATKAADEKEVEKDDAGLYIIIGGAIDIDDLSDKIKFTIREVYHYSESILFSMPQNEREKFLKEFIDSTETQMEEFSNAMIKLEEDPENEELINSAFRSMHTVKGSAGFIGLKSFGETAHKIENIMDKIRDARIAITEDVITLLLNALDRLVHTLDAFKNDHLAPSNLLDIQNELDDFLHSHLTKHGKEAAVDKASAKETEKAGDDISEETDFDFSALTPTEQSELKEYLSKMGNLYNIKYNLLKNTSMKSMKASIIETKLEKEGIIIKSDPTIDEIIDDKKGLEVNIVYISNNDKKIIEKMLNIDQVSDIRIDKINTDSLLAEETDEPKKEEPVEQEKPQTAKEPVKAKKAAPPAAAQGSQQSAVQEKPITKPITTTTVRVDIDKLDSLMNLAGELVITKARFSQLVSNMKGLIEKNSIFSTYIDDVSSTINDIHKSVRNIGATSNGQSSKEFNKLEKLFTSINDIIGKIALKSSIKSNLNKVLELEENTLKLGKISSDLQNGIMQTRMVPVENVFSRFKRVVRDLSKSLKKDVKLDIYGEETELDKKIIDELADPLTHMIRNSLDHGIETKEERIAQGKSEVATVTLSAYHKGNHICIEVSDDGKGIDVDMLVKHTIDKGMLTEKDADMMAYKDKLDLIFLPGLSMAKEVTGVSGRGVGMDVVKKMIESVNGSVDIITEIGKGSTFIINIPLTLAIIQALLVVISEEVYAIPLESVIEIIKVGIDDIYHIDGGETIKIRGHALSIIDLRDTISIRKCELEKQTHKTVVVVTIGEEQLGIVLDSLIGEQEIVIKSLSEHFSNVKGIVGASVLGDGTIALILDIQTIIKLAA